MRPIYIFVRDLPLVLEPGDADTYSIHMGPILLGTLHDDGVFIARAQLPEPNSPDDEVAVTGIDADQRIRLAVVDLVELICRRGKLRADQLHLTAVGGWARSPGSDPTPSEWARLRRGCP